MYWRISDAILNCLNIADDEKGKDMDEIIRLVLHIFVSSLMILFISFKLNCIYTTIFSVIIYQFTRFAIEEDIFFDFSSYEKCGLFSTLIFCTIGFVSNLPIGDFYTCLATSGILTIGFICMSTTNIGKNILKFMDNLLTIK